MSSPFMEPMGDDPSFTTTSLMAPAMIASAHQSTRVPSTTAPKGPSTTSLSPDEVFRLKQLLSGAGIRSSNSNNNNNNPNESGDSSSSYHAATDQQVINATFSQDSDYSHFASSTHAWAVFADDPRKRAGVMERVVGTMIIAFQLFTYYLFAKEAIEDYRNGRVPVLIDHEQCVAADFAPQGYFECEADYTDNLDALAAYTMLGIFLASDFIQAGRAIYTAPVGKSAFFFACLAGVEVVSAFLGACVAISYNLHIGEVTDAIEVGVGLLFIRELSQRAYAGIKSAPNNQFTHFFGVVAFLILLGMLADPLCERIFA